MADKLFFVIKPQQIDLFSSSHQVSFVFHEHEMQSGVIHNPTQISRLLRYDLQKHNLHGKPARVLFDESLVLTQLVSATDQQLDLVNAMRVQVSLNTNWDYQAVLKPGLLIQYHLLFAQSGIYVEQFTSEMAFKLKYLRQTSGHDLSKIDHLDKLREVAKYYEGNWYAKFSQLIGDI